MLAEWAVWDKVEGVGWVGAVVSWCHQRSALDAALSRPLLDSM